MNAEPTQQLPGRMPPAQLAARWQALLRHVCGHLGLPPEEGERVVEEQALQVDGIGFALHLDTGTQQVQLYADCGVPPPWQENEVYRHLLEDALENDMPALSFGLHPRSRRVVAKACLSLPVMDDDGWLCTAVLLACVARVHALRARFTLEPAGHP